MATLSVRFPNSVHDAVRDFSKKDNISINQFVVSAVIEKLTALETENYLEQKAASGNSESFHRVLGKVPHILPENKADIIAD